MFCGHSRSSPSTRDVTDGFPPQSSPSERRDTQLEEREEVLPSPPMLPDSPGGTCVDLYPWIFSLRRRTAARGSETALSPGLISTRFVACLMLSRRRSGGSEASCPCFLISARAREKLRRFIRCL